MKPRKLAWRLGIVEAAEHCAGLAVGRGWEVSGVHSSRQCGGDDDHRRIIDGLERRRGWAKRPGPVAVGMDLPLVLGPGGMLLNAGFRAGKSAPSC